MNCRVGPRQLIDIGLNNYKNEANLVLKMAVSIAKVQGEAKIGLMKFWEVENGGYELREPAIHYNSDFDPKNTILSQENTYLWIESI